ncbi:MAG: hypothetical protein J6W37_04675 [Bacteroidales bacterium]|nr:hypothetical protein [Bacteroidales bacterium]
MNRQYFIFGGEAGLTGKEHEKPQKYFPKDRDELKHLLDILIKERGNEADFNDIDTSKVTDMSRLFENQTEFNGDIDSKNELGKYWEYFFLGPIEYATFDEVEAAIKRASLDKNNWSRKQYDFYEDFLLTRQIQDKYISTKIYEGIRKLYDLDSKAAEYKRIIKEKTNSRFKNFVSNPYSIENYLKSVSNEYKIYMDSSSTSYSERDDIVTVTVPCAVYYANFNNTGQPAVKREVFQISITADNNQSRQLLTRTDLPKEEKLYVEKLRKKERMEKDSIHILNSIYALENYLQEEFQKYGKTVDSKAQDITPLGGYKIYRETAVITKTDVSVEITCQILKKEGKNVQIWDIPFILTTDNDRLFLDYDLNKANRIENKELEKELSQKIKKEPLVNPLNN